MAAGRNITAAYWFGRFGRRSPTALAVARGLADTFAGIWPVDVPALVAAELIGAAIAAALAG